MKKLYQVFILLITITAINQASAERSCHASDRSCSWGYGNKDRRWNHDRDGLASAAVRPVDWVLGDSEVAYAVTTPARVPADAVLPPWPYLDRD